MWINKSVFTMSYGLPSPEDLLQPVREVVTDITPENRPSWTELDPVGTASVPNERRNVPQDGSEDVIITTDMSNDDVRNESRRAANAIEALRRSAPDREAGLEARSELLNLAKHRRTEPAASAEEP